MELTIANHSLTLDVAAEYITDYCQRYSTTVLYYDLSGEPHGTVQPSDGVQLIDIGRLSLINPDLSGSDVATLLTKVGPEIDWTLVPGSARLEDADPTQRDGLYDRMETLWRQVRRPNIGVAKASKLLHMKRPFAFPIIDSYVRTTYLDRATAAGNDLARTRPRGSVQPHFWAAIRQDLIRGADTFDALRALLRDKEPPAGSAVRLPNLRFIDVLAWKLRG